MEITNILLLVIFVLFPQHTIAAENKGEESNDVLLKLDHFKDYVNKEVAQMKNDLIMEMKKNIKMDKKIAEIEQKLVECRTVKSDVKMKASKESYNASDLEERVQMLELEVSTLQAALVEVSGNVDNLEASQNTQDERMNSIEDDINNMEGDVNSLESGYVDLLVRVDTNEENIVLHREQINVLENDLDNVAEKVVILDGRVTELEGSDEDISVRLEELETFANVTESMQLDSRVEALEQVALNHEEELQALETNTTALINDISELQVDVRENELDITDISNKVDILDNIVGLDAVGFHAILNDLTAYPNQIVVYGDVWLNLGNAYDNSSGIFSAPQRGLYYFSMHVRHVRPDTMRDEFRIEKNGVGQCSATTDSETTETTIYDDSSCNVVLQLETGDTVNVYATGTTDVDFNGNIANYFNGFFIRGL